MKAFLEVGSCMVSHMIDGPGGRIIDYHVYIHTSLAPRTLCGVLPTSSSLKSGCTFKCRNSWPSPSPCSRSSRAHSAVRGARLLVAVQKTWRAIYRSIVRVSAGRPWSPPGIFKRERSPAPAPTGPPPGQTARAPPPRSAGSSPPPPRCSTRPRSAAGPPPPTRRCAPGA